jgi:hypothetical protein
MKALTTALQAKLAADTTLMDKVSAIYTAAPNSPTYPYVRIAKVTSTPGYTYKRALPERYLYDIRVIDKGHSQDVALTALDQIQAILELDTLTITGRDVQRMVKVADTPEASANDADGTALIQVGATYAIVLG